MKCAWRETPVQPCNGYVQCTHTQPTVRSVYIFILIFMPDLICPQSEVQAEFIIPMDEKLIVLTGVGLGLLVLIFLTIIMCKVRVRFQTERLLVNDKPLPPNTLSHFLKIDMLVFGMWSNDFPYLSQVGLLQEEKAA